MPIISMPKMTGTEFDAWYTKHRKGNTITEFASLSKEDRGKARRMLKYDVTRDKIKAFQKQILKMTREGVDWPILMKFYDDHIVPLINTPDLFPSGGAQELEDELIDEIREERKIYKARA